MSLLSSALNYLYHGMSVIPCDFKTKSPTIKWQHYALEKPMPKDLVYWFGKQAKSDALAIIGGNVSGNLELIDFDKPSLFPEFEKEISKVDNAIMGRLAISKTQNGGFHLYYRSKGVVGRNQKLAMHTDNSGRPKTAIETRGNGGYVLAPPSPKYQWIQGDIDKIPIIGDGERNNLIEVARSFNQIKEHTPIEHKQKQVVTPINLDRPGDLFNYYADISPLLVKHGWKFQSIRGECEYWTRPGKQEGISATFNYKGCNCLYVFSSNAYPFEINTSYSPFAIYAFLECGGSFRLAAAKLVEMGFVKTS